MSKTINDLVNFMENAVAEKWWYVWGANGEVFTEELKQKLIKQFSNPDTSENPYNKNYYENLFKSHKGKHVADCSGLITAFVGIENDKTAQGFYNYCSIKGTRNNYNGSVGYLLFDQDGSTMVHVGVAVGNNMVIHSKGSSYGVVKESIGSRWTHYGVLPDVNTFASVNSSYIASTSPLLEICWLQSRLNYHLNISLVVDGEYGATTAGAVVSYATKKGLTYTQNGYFTGSNIIAGLKVG